MQKIKHLTLIKDTRHLGRHLAFREKKTTTLEAAKKLSNRKKRNRESNISMNTLTRELILRNTQTRYFFFYLKAFFRICSLSY